MHRSIHDVNLGWGQFLDYYSDLNNARKENDEKYIERNYIGEEIPEPDEAPIVNNELLDNYEENKQENDEEDFFSEFDDSKILTGDSNLYPTKSYQQKMAEALANKV